MPNAPPGLNPFEIRGGLKRCLRSRPCTKPRLNPFEIRGGLKLELDTSPESLDVLIPLKSGVA